MQQYAPTAPGSHSPQAGQVGPDVNYKLNNRAVEKWLDAAYLFDFPGVWTIPVAVDQGVFEEMAEIILRVTNRVTKTKFYLTQASDDHTLSRCLCLCCWIFAGCLGTAGCTLRPRLNCKCEVYGFRCGKQQCSCILVMSMVASSAIHIHILENIRGGGNLVSFPKDEKNPTLQQDSPNMTRN